MAATTILPTTPPLSPHQGLAGSPMGVAPRGVPTIIVVDPMSRKLNIPLDCIQETLAAQRVGIPSLCMLFLQSRCRQGVNCHQVHADPAVVLKLREAAQQYLMCCATHGDPTNLPEIWNRYKIQIQGGSGTVIPMNRVAYTQGLHRLLDEHMMHHQPPTMEHHSSNDSCDHLNAGNEAEITATYSPNSNNRQGIVIAPVQMICRLHGQDRCRFSEDCKFLHLCKELLWTELSIAAPATPPRRFSGNPGPMFNGANYGINTMYGAPPPPPPPGHYDSMPMPPPPFNPRNMYMNSPAAHQQPQFMFAPSAESLTSMDLSPTPPLTPTSPDRRTSQGHQQHTPPQGLLSLQPVHLNSPSQNLAPSSPLSSSITMRANNSFSYEPYSWNPFVMPPTVAEQQQ